MHLQVVWLLPMTAGRVTDKGWEPTGFGSRVDGGTYLLVLFFAQAQCELELTVLIQVISGWRTASCLRLCRRALQ